MFSTPETSVHVLDKNREISPYMTSQFILLLKDVNFIGDDSDG